MRNPKSGRQIGYKEPMTDEDVKSILEDGNGVGPSTVGLLVALEKEYGLLSCDLIHQDKLFEMQEKLMKLMCQVANMNPATGIALEKDLPYIFKTEVK